MRVRLRVKSKPNNYTELYSVNMLDNMMLGSYDQNALSGAATVNQIFFVVNQLAIAIGNALIVMSSQYWGKKIHIRSGN